MKKTYEFRKINGLTSFLKLLLGVGVVLCIVSFLSSAIQADMLAADEMTEEQVSANDTREAIIAFTSLSVFFVTAITFLRWIVRAQKNVLALGAKDLRISPGWAAGYFFVPFLNLWKPYQAMSDLWKASHNPKDWQDFPTGAILPLWWTLWLVSSFVGRISFRLSMAADDVEKLRTATYVQMVNECLDIPLTIFAFLLVSKIAIAQTQQGAADT